jgi:hypothetical protein
MAAPLPSKPLRDNEYLFLIMTRKPIGPLEHQHAFFKPEVVPLTEVEEARVAACQRAIVIVEDVERWETPSKSAT